MFVLPVRADVRSSAATGEAVGVGAGLVEAYWVQARNEPGQPWWMRMRPGRRSGRRAG